MIAGCASAGADDNWFPYPVEVWDPSFDQSSSREQHEYVPLDSATKAWRIAVSFPHMKDAYWLAVNYGVVDEARRLGIGIDLVDAPESIRPPMSKPVAMRLHRDGSPVDQ